MHDGSWALVVTGAMVAALGMTFALVGLDDADKVASAVGGLTGVAALGFSVWVWLRSRTNPPANSVTPAPTDTRVPRPTRQPIRLSRPLKPLGWTNAENTGIRLLRAATILSVVTGAVFPLTGDPVDTLLVGPIFGIPFGIAWWYRVRRQTRTGRWIHDALATFVVAGFAFYATRAVVDGLRPRYFFLFMGSLIVIALLGWVSTAIWTIRAAKDLRG